MAGDPQTQTFDPDAFHQSYVQQSGGGSFDPDAFHAQYTGAQTPAEKPPAGPSFNQRLTEQRTPAPYDPQHPLESAARYAGTELGNLGAAGINSVESMAHPIDTAKKMVSGIPAALKSVADPSSPPLDPGYTIGSVIPFLGAGEALGEAAPKIKSSVGGAIDRVGPSAGKAEALSNRALFPREMPVGEQPEVKEEFGRVFRNVGPYTKAAPIPKGEGGAMAGAQQVRQAAQNIWDEKVEPVLDSYGHVQRPTDDIAEKIRGTISKTDRQLDSPRVAATDKLASLYDGKVQTVRDMANRVTELNNDKAVARFQNMDANGQSQALLADPALRGKVAELNALRDKMFKTIGDEGGETLGDEFRESRKDWGALRNYEDRVLNAKVPTPQPMTKRLATTVRGLIGLKNDPLAAGANDTLFRSNNPNRLIPKALNMAGRSGAAGMPRPSIAQQGVSEPIGPRLTNRMLPAAGESSFGNALDERQAPGGPKTKTPSIAMPESASQTFPLARREMHGIEPQAWDAAPGRAGGPSSKVPPLEMPGIGAHENAGKLSRVPGKNYRSVAPIEVGPRTPVPPAQRLGANEPASSIPLADQRAPLRAKLRAIIEDPAATAAEKSVAKQKLGKLYVPIGGRTP